MGGSKKRAYHPAKPGKYAPPATNTPGYIKGTDAVAGFGEKDYYTVMVESKVARDIITKHHYSHTVVNNSYCHLGVYYRQNLAGILQLGYALNPACAGKIVEGTRIGEYLELNRMWLSDVCPHNSESRAISYAIKFIKRAMPTVAWIQSFADSRCGRLGVTYQAANFIYCGCHKTEFYFLDCDFFHPMLLTAHKKCGERGRRLKANKLRAIKLSCTQYRYIYFIKRSWRNRLRLKPKPYPKPEK